MRKILLFVLMIALLLTMIGCGKQKEETQPTTTQAATTEPAGTTSVEPTENMGALEDSDFGDETEETTSPTEETEPLETDPEENDPEDNDPERNDPEETDPVTPEATKPTEAPAGDSENADPMVAEYEAFTALDPVEQQKFVESFATIDQFFDWYNAAKAAYEAANPPIDVGDGKIDLEEIIGGQS